MVFNSGHFPRGEAPGPVSCLEPILRDPLQRCHFYTNNALICFYRHCGNLVTSAQRFYKAL